MPTSDQQLLLANLILFILNISFLLFAFHKLSKFVKSIYTFMKDLKIYLDREIHGKEDDDPTKD